jgi:hypothetical protein
VFKYTFAKAYQQVISGKHGGRFTHLAMSTILAH